MIMVTFFLIFPTLQDPTLKAKGVELPANLARVRIIAVLADVAFHPSLIRFGNAPKKNGPWFDERQRFGHRMGCL